MTHYYSGSEGLGNLTAEVARRLRLTNDDNDPSPVTWSPKPHDMTETGAPNSRHCCSEDEGHKRSNLREETTLQPGCSMESDEQDVDEQDAHHNLAILKQPNDAIGRANPWPSTNTQLHHRMIEGSPSVRGFIPMPPTPIHIPTLQEKMPSGQKFTWIEALEHNASLLDDQSLYRAFQLRRGDHPEMKGPKLVSAMAEYVGDAEEKLANLQQCLRRFKEQATRPQVGTPGRVEGTGRQETPIPADPLDEVSLETRFYYCKDGFASMTGRVQQSVPIAQTRGGQYTSSCDPNYLIRVQFDWKESVTFAQPVVARDIPDAKDIDVLTFMVSSRPLTVFFERRLGLNVDRFPILKIGKPFRVVISNYVRLKNQLTNLMRKYGSGNERYTDANLHETSGTRQSFAQQSGPAAASSSEYEKESQIFDQESALEHFRLLIQFIDQYLGDKVALFQAFQAGGADMVAFEDLWMLFNNGQKIICPLRENRVTIDVFNGKSGLKSDNDDDSNRYHLTRRRYVPQAYRVTAAVGGAPLISSLAPKRVDAMRGQLNDDPESQFYYGSPSVAPALRRARQRLSSLQVSCMYVDFDGTKYGIDMEIFVFKPFDGQVPVKTLEAYPLKYSVTSGSHDLAQRGRKFIDLTASPCHMNHAGITIGETKEEVRCKPCLYFTY